MFQKNRITGGRQGKANVRLLILLGLLVLVGAAFLYDKYSLMPAATDKINTVLNEVTLSLNDGNRKAVEEIVGMKPSNTFKHGNLEVVQYRFPRGLPFYPRPILDVAYDGNAIAFVKPHELTPEWLDQNKPTIMVGDLDRDNRDESKIVGLGGGGGSTAETNDDQTSDASPDDSDDGSDLESDKSNDDDRGSDSDSGQEDSDSDDDDG